MGFLSDIVSRVKNAVYKLPTTPEKQATVNQQITRDAGGNKFLDTMGQGLNNWIVAPAMQVPLRMQEATKARKEKRYGDWALNTAQAVGGLIPGIDDAAWAGINAVKNAAAGKSFKEGLAGNEFSGIGDVGKRYGLNDKTAQTLNMLELPLMLAAGGIKAKSAMKHADEAANVLKAETKTADILQSLTADAIAKNLIPDETTIKSTKAVIDAGADIHEVTRHFDEQLGFQTGKGHEQQIIKNGNKTLDQIQAEENASVDTLLKRGKPQVKPAVPQESRMVQDILNDRYTGPDAETTFPKSKGQILDGVTTEKTALVQSPQQLVDQGRLAGKTDNQLIEELTNQGVDISSVDLIEGAVPQLKTQDILSPVKEEPSIPVVPPELVAPKTTGDFVDEMVGGYGQRLVEKTGKEYVYNPVSDFNVFGEKIKPSLAVLKSPEQKAAILQNVAVHIKDIAKKSDTPFDVLVDQVEQGLRATPSQRALASVFETFREYSKSTGVNVGEVKGGYFFHQTKEAVDKILTGAQTNTVGDIFSKPFFSFKRTGKLTDYDKSPRAVMAYAVEALKNTGLKDADQGYIDAAIKISKDIQNSGKADVVSAFADANRKAGVVPEKIFAIEAKAGKGEPGLGTKLTESLLSEAAKTDDKFWTTFVLPFREAMTNANTRIADILKSGLTDAEKAKEIKSVWGSEYKIAGDRYAEALKKFEPGDNYTRFLINEVGNTFIGDAKRLESLGDKALGVVRQNVNRAMLGLNVFSAINNSFEISRIGAAVSSASMKKATAMQVKGVNLLDKYGIGDAGFVQDKAGAKLLQKFDEGLFYMFDRTERLKNNYSLLSFEQEGIKKGLQGTALKEYVLKNFDRYAIAFGKGNDVFAVKSPLAKTIMQYLTYSLRDSGIYYDELKNGNIKFAIKRGLGIAAQIGALGFLTGQINPGSAFSPLGLVSNLVQGKVGGPVVQGLVKFFAFTQADDKQLGQQSGDYNSEKAKRGAIDTAMALVGMPAYNQLWNKTGAQAMVAPMLDKAGLPGGDTFDTLFPQGTFQTQKRGYKQTYTGNVAYPAPTDPWEIARSAVFGESGTPEAKEYYRAVAAGENPSLSKKETEVFKQATPEMRTDMYNRLKAKDAGKLAKEKATSDILAGKEATLPETQSMTISYLDAKDNLQELDLAPITPPTLSGNETIDKALKSEYKSTLGKQIKGIIDLYQLKKITLEEATALMQSADGQLKAIDNATKGAANAKATAKKRVTAANSLLKQSITPIKMPKSPSMKTIKVLKTPSRNTKKSTKTILKTYKRI